MNRQIKFRAWDTLNKCWLKSGEYGIYNGDGGLWCGKHNMVILQQSSEYTDKNGKEIYEGDIIQYSFYGDVGYDPEPPLVIRYAEGYSNWALMPFKLDGERWDFYGGWPHEEITIIGNIFENPELLKF
jgi:uncharacterized phage protein (TIGR01671 family)